MWDINAFQFSSQSFFRSGVGGGGSYLNFFVSWKLSIMAVGPLCNSKLNGASVPIWGVERVGKHQSSCLFFTYIPHRIAMTVGILSAIHQVIRRLHKAIPIMQDSNKGKLDLGHLSVDFQRLLSVLRLCKVYMDIICFVNSSTAGRSTACSSYPGPCFNSGQCLLSTGLDVNAYVCRCPTSYSGQYCQNGKVVPAFSFLSNCVL